MNWELLGYVAAPFLALLFSFAFVWTIYLIADLAFPPMPRIAPHKPPPLTVEDIRWMARSHIAEEEQIAIDRLACAVLQGKVTPARIREAVCRIETCRRQRQMLS